MATGYIYSTDTPSITDFSGSSKMTGVIVSVLNVSNSKSSDYSSIGSNGSFHKTYHSLQVKLKVTLSTGESTEVTQTMNGNSENVLGKYNSEFKPFILIGCRTTPEEVIVPIEVEPYEVPVPGVYCECIKIDNQTFVSEV